MPVVRDLPVHLEADDALRRQGLGGKAGVRPEVAAIIKEMIATVQAEHLLAPLMAYELLPITGLTHDKVLLEGGRVVSGKLLPPLVARAEALAVAVVTIGDGLEKRVTAFNNAKEPLRAILLDGIGSAAVDTLMQDGCAYIANLVAAQGLKLGSPVNPGMPGLELGEQWPLLEMANAAEIGVSLTASGVMVPRKSTSMVMGVGKEMEVWTRAEVCQRCNLSETCPYRIEV